MTWDPSSSLSTGPDPPHPAPDATAQSGLAGPHPIYCSCWVSFTVSTGLLDCRLPSVGGGRSLQVVSVTRAGTVPVSMSPCTWNSALPAVPEPVTVCGRGREQLTDAATTGRCKKVGLLLIKLLRPLLSLESHPGKGNLKECLCPRNGEFRAFPKSS